MADLTEFEAYAAGITAGAMAFTPEGAGQFAVVPKDYKLAGLEQFQAAPDRIRADHRFVEVGSLATYINTFDGGATLVTADYSAAKIAAMIDGDLKDAPSHKTHTACFVAQMHDTVKAWLGQCGKPMTQAAFGLFLENRAVDVVAPPAADVFDMVMKFEATKKVSFMSATRLHDDSRQMVYKEENEQRGAMTLPDRFIVQAPVYRGMEPQQIIFMVRYRIEDGSLIFLIDMHDKDAVLREAFDRCIDGLKVGLTAQLPVYVVG